MRFRSPFTLALAVACLVLAAIWGFELMPLAAKAKPVVAYREKEAPLVAIAGRFSLPPEDSFNEIAERPLFIKTRQPPKPAEKAGDPRQKPSRAGQYKLTGVVLSPHERVAILKDAANKKVERIAEGRGMQGWTVKKVAADSVLLSREGEAEEQNLPLVRKTPEDVKLLIQRAAAKRHARQSARAKMEKTSQTPASQQRPRGQPPRPLRNPAVAPPEEEGPPVEEGEEEEPQAEEQ